jgi:flagellar hook-associated protein 3 FlgL
MIFNAGVNAINTQTASLLHLQQQIASGRRILTPADDPVGAARALEVTQAKDVTAQYSTNHDNAKTLLGLEEVQLTSAIDLMVRLKELTVQAGNGTLSDDNRRGIAVELRARFDALLGIANATDGSGQYMFAGYMGATPPFAGTVAGGVSYSGDDGQRRLQVAPTRFLEVGDSGNDVFNRIRNGNGTFATTYGTNNVTPGPNLGTGVINGGAVTNPAAWVAPSSGSYTIRFSGAPSATSYQIYDGITDLTGAMPFTAGQAIALPPLASSGAHVVVTGAPSDGDSFVVSPSSSQSVFASLANLITTLEAGTATAADRARYNTNLGSAMINLDQATDNFLRVRAAIGSRLNEVDSLSDMNQELQLQYAQTLSTLQDLDFVKGISDLTRKQTGLEAAQQSFVRVSQLSLFNYL